MIHNHTHKDCPEQGYFHKGQSGNCPTAGANSRRLLIAASLTGSFMLVEVAGGMISGSLALIADAGHMLTDFLALIAAYIGVNLRSKKAASYIALGSGVSLLAVAAWVFKEAYERIGHPHEVLGGPMLIVAVLGLLVNIIVFKILIGGDRENLNMRAAILHVATDMLGSVAAILAAVIILFTGYYLADPILSTVVGGLIIISALPLIKGSVKALKDAPAHKSSS